MSTAHDGWCRLHDNLHHPDEGCQSCALGKPPLKRACPHCKEHQEQASYWKAHSQDVERQLKTLLLEKKELVSKLERLKPRF